MENSYNDERKSIDTISDCIEVMSEEKFLFGKAPKNSLIDYVITHHD